jgi:glycine oxidase
MSQNAADVIVVGAGIIGAALARELASARLSVVVVERDAPGAGASGAAAGILSPQAEADAPSPLLDLCLESRAIFPGLVEELRAETGIDVPYRTTGTLYLALDDEEESRLSRRFEWQTSAGLPVERLSAGRVLTLEPAVAAGARIALRFPYDHQIDTAVLTRALAVSAEARGARFVKGAEVHAILEEGGRVVGVALTNEKIRATRVVNCAGAWASALTGSGPRLPIEPVRGQMLALEHEELRLDRVIFTERGYLVPRLDGRILVGSTMERAGFDARPTVAGAAALLALARQVAPGLETATITALWAGLRPAAPDGLPVLGPAGAPWASGLYFATGHYRNGVLLAPVTARLLAESIITGKTSISLAPFAASRLLV